MNQSHRALFCRSSGAFPAEPMRLVPPPKIIWGAGSTGITESSESTVFFRAWVREEITLRKPFSLPAFSQYSQYSQYSQNPGRMAHLQSIYWGTGSTKSTVFLRLGARRNYLVQNLFLARFLPVLPVFPVLPEPGKNGALAKDLLGNWEY